MMSLEGLIGLLENAERLLSQEAEDSRGPFHEAMRESCALVQRTAQEEVGSYQPAAGPFPAWPNLEESTKADRERRGYPADEPLLRTGDMAASVQYVIQGNDGYVGSNEETAVFQELGTTHIPPRSFLGRAAFVSVPEIRDIFARAALKAVTGGAE